MPETHHLWAFRQIPNMRSTWMNETRQHDLCFWNDGSDINDKGTIDFEYLPSWNELSYEKGLPLGFHTRPFE
jgi:hypothetical protein